MSNKIKKSLVMSVICGNFVILSQVEAELSINNIPEDSLSSTGKKVTICHYPPGKPDNYQNITIDRKALSKHIDHHDDVFARSGVCDAIPKTMASASSLTSATSSPTSSTSSKCAVPSGILDKVLKLLPEGKAMGVNSSLLTQDAQANVLLKKDANIKVAFVYEGAGYTNTLSSFTFDKTKLGNLTSNLISEKVVFSNFSQSGSGGSLRPGDTVDLGSIASGTGVGFTIISNGWDSSKNVLKTNRTVNQVFRTVKGLNPESIDKKNHTVLLSDPSSQVLVIAFEDLNREKSLYNDSNYSSDDDFNDAVLAICVDPWDAIDNVTSLIDIDPPTSTPPITPDTVLAIPPTTVDKIKGTTGRQTWSEINK